MSPKLGKEVFITKFLTGNLACSQVTEDGKLHAKKEKEEVLRKQFKLKAIK